MFVCFSELYFPSDGSFLFDLEADSVIKVNNCAVVFGFLEHPSKAKSNVCSPKLFFSLLLLLHNLFGYVNPPYE